MRKKLLSIIAVISAFLVSVSALSGCNLVSTDSERDMAQVVATVQISEDAPLEKIEKKEMVMAYLNYGYYYSQNGYSSEQIFNVIIDNLVNSRIMVQHSVITFDASATAYKRDGKDKWDVERYLTDDDIVEATYNTIQAMNTLIDNNEETSAEKKSETYSGDVRTAPENAAVDTEVSVAEMREYNQRYEQNGADIGAIGSDRYKAYNKALKVLEDNQLLGENVSTAKDTIYYKENLQANEESILIEKLQKSIEKEIRSSVTLEALISEYQTMYNAQKNSIKDAAAFETAMSEATVTSPVVYTPYTGYVYVYNLLLGVDEYQSSLIKKLNEDKNLTDEQRIKERKQVLSSTIAKDLRESWIYSGYDFDFEAGVVSFKNDYKIAEKALTFKGTVHEYAKKTQESAGRYRVDSVNEYGLKDFINLINDYVYDNQNINMNTSYYAEQAIYASNNSSVAEDYDARVQELLYAFSTDSGSLNNTKGYLVAPKADIGKTETYVKEFADAARSFVEDGMGDKSYIVVGTDYGYHVMFFSKQLGANTDYATLVEYLNAVMNMGVKDQAGWEGVLRDMLENWEDIENTDSYLYQLVALYSNLSNVTTVKQNEIINTYKNDANCVVKYADRYADLLKI